ncbi:PilN domain-containing protein [Kordiimonas sp.]|uniref:PilN domain-containing protein n=1 Tax=Kordiimonas sp. TaxID=1970157 RepID=UPI003A942414
MIGFWNPLLKFLGASLQLWACALLDGLPARLRQFFSAGPSTSKVILGSPADISDAFLTHVESKEVDLCVRDDLRIAYSFVVPVAALGEVKNIVALEAERALPLTANLLHMAYTTMRISDTGTAKVQLVAIRRDVVDLIVNSARRSHVNLNEITIEDDDKVAVALPFWPIKKRKILRWFSIIGLTVLLLIVCSLVPTIYKERLEAEIEATEDLTRNLRRQTEGIAVLQRQVRAMQGLSEAVEAERLKSRHIDLLRELTANSPDEIVFQDLRVDGSRIFVRGVAPAPEEWVLLLQSKKAFQDVTLVSIVSTKDREKKRFDLRLDFVWSSQQELPRDEN